MSSYAVLDVPRPTSRITPSWAEVGPALGWLAETVADSPDSPSTRFALAGVVHDLEDLVGATLGNAHTDPIVVLLRRFARAHRLLLTAEHPLDIERVHAHLLALRMAAAPAPPAMIIPHAQEPESQRRTRKARTP